MLDIISVLDLLTRWLSASWIKDKQSVLEMFLPLYSNMGKSTEVEIIWIGLQSFHNLHLDGYVGKIVQWGRLGQLEKLENAFEKILNSSKKVSEKHHNSLLHVYANVVVATKNLQNCCLIQFWSLCEFSFQAT